MEIAELVIAVENSRASNNRHQNHVGCNVLGFETIARLSPSMTKRLHWRFTGHQRVVAWTWTALVDAEHAGGERDQCHDHFPWMRRTKLSMSTKQTSRLHHVNDLCVESGEKKLTSISVGNRKLVFDFVLHNDARLISGKAKNVGEQYWACCEAKFEDDKREEK